MKLKNAILDLILAPVCLGCDSLINPGDTARLICRRCRTLIKPLPSPSCKRCGAPVLKTGRTLTDTCPECESWPPIITSARSSCLLHPPADTIVHQLKYRGWHSLARPMAERMTQIDIPCPTDHSPDHSPRICIPVPTTRSRKRERGYNQAELLARAYADETQREARDWLTRTGARGTQTTLQPAARAANVAGAFALGRDPETKAEYDVRGAHVILIDDVLTTGATAVECAMTLAAAGACCVSILTYARALDARRLIQT